VRKSKNGKRRAWVLIAVHVLVLAHILQWKFGGRTVTPVEPSEAGYLLDAGKLNAGFLLFVALILSTLVLGRWFCGWACHVVAYQDLCAWLLGKIGLRPRPVRSRLLLLAPYVVAFHMFFWGSVERWLAGVPRVPIEASFTTTELWERFPGPLMGVATIAVVGFLIVWWLGAKGFCTYGCPYGAFFGVADRFAPGKIRVTDACDACGHCTSVCTSNVRVHEEVAIHRMVVDPACMKCMDCVSVCPKEALYFGFTAPKPFTLSQQRVKARADFTWPEEIALAVIAVLAVFSFRAAWFGEGVPFLLAVGLGAITAVFGLLGWRLLRRPDVTFQHWSWKRAGKFTGVGRLVLLAIAAWLLLTVDSGVVNYHTWRADLSETALAPRSQSTQRAAELHALDGHLANAVAWSLVDNPRLHLRRGLAQRELALATGDDSRLAEAETELRRAIALRADWPAAILPLADLCNLRGERAEAEKLVRRILQIEPDHVGAKQRLQLIEQQRTPK